MGECSAPGSPAGISGVCVRNKGRTTQVCCAAAVLQGYIHTTYPGYYGRHLHRSSKTLQAMEWIILSVPTSSVPGCRAG